MSTLAAARADNFYYSKNYNPDKVPLKKSELAPDKPFTVVEGQRVGGSKVRYETPFHVRCEGCENMIAREFDSTLSKLGSVTFIQPRSMNFA